MTHDEALAILDAEGYPHAGRFRELCRPGNPDLEQRDGYRETVVRLAGGQPIFRPAPAVDYGAAQGPRPCCGQPLPPEIP